jgi:hypothetical protein
MEYDHSFAHQPAAQRKVNLQTTYLASTSTTMDFGCERHALVKKEKAKGLTK